MFVYSTVHPQIQYTYTCVFIFTYMHMYVYATCTYTALIVPNHPSPPPVVHLRCPWGRVKGDEGMGMGE